MILFLCVAATAGPKLNVTNSIPLSLNQGMEIAEKAASRWNCTVRNG